MNRAILLLGWSLVMTRASLATSRLLRSLRGLGARWRAQGLLRRCELGVWLLCTVACATTSTPPPPASPQRNAQGFLVDDKGCLLAPEQALAQWKDQPKRCGLWLVKDPVRSGRLGLLSGHNGSTLAEGRAPEPCQGSSCAYSSWSTPLGPMVVASLLPDASRNASQIWLGLRHGHHLSFVSLTPSDATAHAGEVIGPGTMLEPWRCGMNLALRVEPSASAKELEEDKRLELFEREGLYVPDGRGWLVVPQKDWSKRECQKLPLTF